MIGPKPTPDRYPGKTETILLSDFRHLETSAVLCELICRMGSDRWPDWQEFLKELDLQYKKEYGEMDRQQAEHDAS